MAPPLPQVFVRLPSAAAPLPSLGGAVTFRIIPGIDIVGEAGRLGNVLPTMSSAAFSVAQTGLRASAFYGEAGAGALLNHEPGCAGCLGVSSDKVDHCASLGKRTQGG
jgi:hypothetical protein